MDGERWRPKGLRRSARLVGVQVSISRESTGSITVLLSNSQVLDEKAVRLA